MKFIGIIPARYASKRFPGKSLADLCGKPVLWHVYNSAKKFKQMDSLWVAADDDRILNYCNSVNIPCLLTNIEHNDCIDRAYETACILQNKSIYADRYIIVQGDEPFFNCEMLDCDLSPEIVNFYTKIANEEQIIDVNTVKAVVSKKLMAIYFSRCPIPYSGNSTIKANFAKNFDKQLGVYSFSFNALKEFNRIGMSYFEGIEGIGLLRFIENDIDVHMRYSEFDSISIDVPEDLKKAQKLLSN